MAHSCMHISTRTPALARYELVMTMNNPIFNKLFKMLGNVQECFIQLKRYLNKTYLYCFYYIYNVTYSTSCNKIFAQKVYIQAHYKPTLGHKGGLGGGSK